MGEYISKYATGTAVDNALDAGLAASAEVINARGGFESLSFAIAAKASEAEAEAIRARLDVLEDFGLCVVNGQLCVKYETEV